jgi:hypothetical protein
MKEQLTNNVIWNEAALTGLVFGGFSSLCLVLKEASALTGSTFVVQLAAIVLWAVEFFGCILLMKHYFLRLRKRYAGVGYQELVKYGRRIALLSGLILAAVDAYIIMKLPQETVSEVMGSIATDLSSSLGSQAKEQVDRVADQLPLFTFIGQWIYCFLYGTILSTLLARYLLTRDLLFPDNPPEDNPEQPEEQ